MNLSPVIASSASPPADAPRSGEPAHAGEFSSVLSQQRGQVRERDAATTSASPKSTQAPAVTEDGTPAPDDTLALLAAGAILPLMMSRADLAGESNASSRGAHTGGSAQAQATPAAAAKTHADSQTMASIAASVLRNATDSLQATERQTPDVLSQSSSVATLLSSKARSTETSLARPYTALTPGSGAAAGAPQADSHGPKPDAAQIAFSRIASEIGLNTRPVSISAGQAINRHAPHDVAPTMAGAAPTLSSGATLLTGQPSSPLVATPLSNPAWAADFSRQFVSMTQGRDMSQPHTIELRLDPPSLGPVRITLHISDSIAQAAFVSPHAVVRQAIENALPQLQQQLADAGLSLGQASVNDQSAGQQGFEQAASQGSRNQSVFSLDGSAAPHTDTNALPPSPRQTPRSPDALVDTFA